MESTILLSAQEIAEGAGAKVRRLFPSRRVMDFDPFVLLDEFFVDPAAGFPEHPHRGFEAMTYMLEGSFRHKDTLGNDTEVSAGGVQRFTAGKGLIHSEMPGKGAQVCHGIQLWVNLPGYLKKIEPSYQQVNKESLPYEHFEGGGIRTVAGPGSPVEIRTEVSYSDISLDKNHLYNISVAAEYNAIVYVYNGSVEVKGLSAGSGQGVLLKDPGRIELNAAEASNIIFLSGKPHGEPIHHNGPYVD